MDIRNEIKKLSAAEKILLVEDIWDEIDFESKTTLSQKKKDDIDKRLEEIRLGKSTSYTWEEVKTEAKKVRDAI